MSDDTREEKEEEKAESELTEEEMRSNVGQLGFGGGGGSLDEFCRIVRGAGPGGT